MKRRIVEATRGAARWAEFEAKLTPSQQERIRRGVQEGIRDIEQGRYQDYDGEGLRALAKELVAASVRTRTRPTTAKRSRARDLPAQPSGT